MMEPDQVRERMELFGLGSGERESDLFLKDVCNSYEELFYQLIEKEDKVNTLNDAVKYYKNMEDNIKQMLSTISEISEKTENAASKSAELTMKEAEQKADMMLADASQKAAQILEEAKQQAQEIVDGADEQTKDAREELAQIKGEFNAYAVRFYDFLEEQKAYFDEHKIDVEQARKEYSVPLREEAGMVQAGRETGAVPYAARENVPEQRSVSFVEKKTADVAASQIRKIPNAYEKEIQPSAQPSPQERPQPTIDEIQANIPEHIRNIPISDHTETLDEIIRSIKKSYEEVENK
jgi:cell division initiation protein